MRIALVRPYYHTHLITPQLGLGYLSSYLRARGMEAAIVDGLNEELSPRQILERCEGYRVVGITCLTDYLPKVVELSRMMKRQKKTVIIGGPHATSLPEMTLEATEADYVVVGEGEETLSELVQALAGGKDPAGVSGVFTGADKPFIPRALIEDIDVIPFPDWERMDPRRYRKAPHGGLIKRFPVAPIVSTRGCSFECSFCASPALWGKRIRFRSPEKIVEEIELLVDRFGVREIHFEDDNLTLRRSHVEIICGLILEKGIDISWAAPNGVRADTLDRDLLKLMKRSGCYFLAFGLESGNQSILDRAGKGVSLDTMKKAIREAKEVGIMTQGFFIFGLPGETEETIAETIEFAKNSGLDRVQCLLLDVLPGSRLWEELRGEYEIDFDRRSYQEVTWCPPGLDRAVLAKAPARAFRSFFFRPKQFLGLIKHMKPSQIKYVIRRIRDFKIF